MEREFCDKWMPRAQEHCARRDGHKGCHRTRDSVRYQNEVYSKREDVRERHRLCNKYYMRWYIKTSAGMLAQVRGNAKQRGNQ